MASAAHSNDEIHFHHLMLQASGGVVADGICLYNFFRAFPLGLTIYNMGAVDSAGALAYVGAEKRIVDTRASFMIHRGLHMPKPANAAQLKSLAECVALDDARIESILRSHLRLSDERWAALAQFQELYFTAEQAIECNMADEIGVFLPPSDALVFNIP